MNICLGEIARCQKLTPRPNFVLLGDRYGWCPLPPQIPAVENGWFSSITVPHSPGSTWKGKTGKDVKGVGK